MANEEAVEIDKAIDDISKLGAVNITCDWKDSRGGYVVTVDFGDNATCEAVDANRASAYRLAIQAARMKKASMPSRD